MYHPNGRCCLSFAGRSFSTLTWPHMIRTGSSKLQTCVDSPVFETESPVRTRPSRITEWSDRIVELNLAQSCLPLLILDRHMVKSEVSRTNLSKSKYILCGSPRVCMACVPTSGVWEYTPHLCFAQVSPVTAVRRSSASSILASVSGRPCSERLSWMARMWPVGCLEHHCK